MTGVPAKRDGKSTTAATFDPEAMKEEAAKNAGAALKEEKIGSRRASGPAPGRSLRPWSTGAARKRDRKDDRGLLPDHAAGL